MSTVERQIFTASSNENWRELLAAYGLQTK